ncbi:protein SPT2 homolog [Dunckerocampus dactyliophorus]|uniref:protein SPT2 homolog n=1 Tax=Dunckerocampus dactyliophorus TaxID=161453 RepID=UPI0024073233|nr:protein SPT2 homolog [Dunckerocampus dactyliophorus]
MQKMMDFDNVLSIATQNQGSVKKRYSLQVGPPKKDARSKGVNPAAVQALLKRRQHEARLKEIEMKKQKQDLVAKRVELKSDRKARAMASRTKDNFHGYNGIPVVEGPKKRRSKQEMDNEKSANDETFQNVLDPEDDEDNYEYEQTDSEPDQDPEPLRHIKISTFSGGSGSSSKPSPKKSSGPPKSAPSTMNFADLLKLAEKKQYQPVELKPKVMKEERLRTAEELRELEIERRAKRRAKDPTTQSSSTAVRKNTSEKEQKNGKPQKSLLERPNQPCGMKKKPQFTPSSKASTGERERDRPKTKVPLKVASSQVPTKQGVPKTSSGHTSIISSELRLKKESSSSVQGRPSGTPQTRPFGTSVRDFKSPNGNPQKTKPTQGSSLKQEHTGVNHKSGKGEPPKSGNHPTVKSSSNSVVRPSSGRPKEGNRPQPRPGGTPQAKAGASSLHGHPAGTGGRPPGFGQGRGTSGGSLPNRQPSGSFGSGPGRPKCTVVSETISSKNMAGPRPGYSPRPGMPQIPGMAPRPGGPTRPLNRPPAYPPGTMLPPITIAYKRKYEEEDEYDSEMEDFIDDGDDEQAEVSKHIKEIFGYDRNKYKDESDYALKFMESSWQDMQKEEAKSLRMAVQEDLEEERKEQEEMKMKNAKRKKN